jgi:hypothetical protein
MWFGETQFYRDRLGEHLCFRDVCMVYAVMDGSRTVQVDFGRNVQPDRRRWRAFSAQLRPRSAGIGTMRSSKGKFPVRSIAPSEAVIFPETPSHRHVRSGP